MRMIRENTFAVRFEVFGDDADTLLLEVIGGRKGKGSKQRDLE